MSLSNEQIRQVAQLARLAMQPEQAEHYARQLTNILDMVSQLAQAHTDGVEPMAPPLRSDVVTEADRRDAFQALAPSVENGLYLVPKVIE
jgi:aspartyl-tRNA(Asn)/glutamyl-tRNA(Gln) amidotransferase subunit C